MDDEEILDEPFALPDPALHPAEILARLVNLDEHSHIKENNIRIEFLMRHDAKHKGGRMVLGTVYEPTVQGELKPLFEMLLAKFFGYMPDFLIIIDKVFWEDEAGNMEREALVFHELCHIKQEKDKFGDDKFDRNGNPVFGLVAHDLEEFNAVVARYGAWKGDISSFVAAVRQ